MKKRLLSTVLSIIIVVCIISSSINYALAIPASPAGNVLERIQQLRSIFPDGSYFSANGAACGHSNLSSCSNCSLSGVMTKKLGYSNTAGMPEGWACVAFAKYAYYYVFGIPYNTTVYNYNVPSNSSSISLAQAKPGDIFVWNFKHMAMYLGNNQFFHSNFGGINKVSYGSATKHGNPDYIIRANNYDQINNSSTNEMEDVTHQFLNQIIAIKSVQNGKYVSAWMNDSRERAPTYARVDKIGEWEKFQVESAANGWIALKSIENKRYLSATLAPEKSVPILAAAQYAESWEHFKIFKKGNDYYIKAKANGNWLTAFIDQANTPIRATQSVASTWERFSIHTVSVIQPPPVVEIQPPNTGGNPDGGNTAPPNEPPVKPEPSFVNPFTDVKESDWFYKDVAYVYSNGLFSGVSSTKFAPNMSMTRGMTVTALYRMAGNPYAFGGNNPFYDVPETAYYRNAVVWAVNRGIVSGVGGGRFAPDSGITRQDVAVIFVRYANKMGIPLPAADGIIGFQDASDISGYAKDSVSILLRAKIIGGRPGNIFDPKGKATRAEVAAMIRSFSALG